MRNKSSVKGNNNVVIQSSLKEDDIITKAEFTTTTATIKPKRGKSIIKIGNSEKGGVDIKIEVITKFNWFQKKMWKYLLNIEIEDIKEELDNE